MEWSLVAVNTLGIVMTISGLVAAGVALWRSRKIYEELETYRRDPEYQESDGVLFKMWRRPDAEAVRVAKIGGAFALAGVVLTASFNLLDSYLSRPEPPPVACLDERLKAAELVEKNANAWTPLSSADRVEEACEINTYVEGLINP